MHKFLSTTPRTILQTWLEITCGIYPATGYRSIDRNVPKKIILPLDRISTCYAILYFVRNLPGAPGRGSLFLLYMSVKYAQPSYAVAVYGIAILIIASNRFKEWCPSTWSNKHSYNRL